MKKFLMIAVPGVLLLFLLDWLYFSAGVLYLPSLRAEPEYFAKAEGGALYLDQGSGYAEFELKGVNLGLGKPGHYATELAITKEEYLRWFEQIKDLGANVIRTYTLAGPDFYEAFYEFNRDKPFFRDCKKTVDVVHGRHKEQGENSILPRFYRWDISPWVCGYILGVEWEGTLVTYTDQSFPQREQLDGEYFYTEDASNFEIFLASAGEKTAAYETQCAADDCLLQLAHHGPAALFPESDGVFPEIRPGRRGAYPLQGGLRPRPVRLLPHLSLLSGLLQLFAHP